MKLPAIFRKHNFVQIGTATCYHQKNSKFCKCSKCGLTGFVAKEMNIKILNTYGCKGE